MPPAVAIIMRSKNEMPHLRSALDMLERQTYRNYEFFAVDSGSTDGSLDHLRQHCSKEHLLEIAPDEYVPGKVLNEAIVRTRHPIVVLLNADAIPLDDQWLEKLVQPLLDDQADATFSRQVARPNARFVVAYDYERAYDPDKMDADFFSAAACAFKRDLWECHPFREQGYAEDSDWACACRNAGARLQIIPDSVVEHSHDYSLKELFAKRYRQALTLDRTPHMGRQIFHCLKESGRDFLHACGKLKLHTIPYNLAYRITIHRAEHCGLKDRAGDIP
jgi:rhamnosyltransferase